jgi:hypothetical protein
MNLKLNQGADELFERFDKHGVTELIDPTRPDVTRSRWKFCHQSSLRFSICSDFIRLPG